MPPRAPGPRGAARAGAAVLTLLSVAVFVPLKYLYPSKAPRLRKTTNGLGFLWVMLFALAVAFPERTAPFRLAELTLAYPIYYLALSAWLGRRLLAKPLATVAGELDHIERFELDAVKYHPSRLTELDELSGTIARMASGLVAFRKYLPADLVRILVSEGIEARPGGTQKELTVLFADVAGFTGMSERLGEQVVPLLGAYLDIVSNTVQRERGTVDKFIGDAVMAFWGAPNENPDHAAAACRAALKAVRAVQAAGLADDRGVPLHVRIGINSGSVLVGNIGSDARLNYTVIGDAVNVASRLESANKRYGSSIIIGEHTRQMAGAAIVVRKLDTVAVYGRMGGTAIYELVGMDGEPAPAWIGAYEEGLARYTRPPSAAPTMHSDPPHGPLPRAAIPALTPAAPSPASLPDPPPAPSELTHEP